MDADDYFAWCFASHAGLLATLKGRAFSAVGHMTMILSLLQAVPKGTNGAVSLLGLAAGLAGGALIGASFWVASLGDTNWGQQPIGLVKSVASGLLWGLIGTLLDSLLGAVLQNSTVVPPDGKVASKPASGGVHISGYDVLTNEAVNFVTVNATAALAGFVPL